MSKRNMVAPGCYFEPDESEEVTNPIMGKRKSGFMPNEPTVFRSHSELEDIPDNFLERMKARRGEIQNSTPVRKVITPAGFAVSIAYNKSGYQLIPKEDLKR